MGIFRLGVFGGTFNPIHLGHLHIARSIQKLFSLSEIRFVVAATPPHKSQKSIIALTHRYAMVCLATSEERAFVPSLIELEPHASPYSVDTLRKIGRSAGVNRQRLFFIAGGDSLRDVKTWRESEKLLTTYNIIFALRPGAETVNFRDLLPEKARDRVCDCTGFSRGRIQRLINEIRPGKNRLFIVDIDAPDISATGIRERAAAGRNFRASVPGPVHAYIKKLHLYGGR